MLYYGRNQYPGFVEVKKNIWIHEAFDHYIYDEDVLVCLVKKKAKRNDLLKLLFKRSSFAISNDSFQRIPNDFIKRCGLPGVDEGLCHILCKKN